MSSCYGKLKSWVPWPRLRGHETGLAGISRHAWVPWPRLRGHETGLAGISRHAHDKRAHSTRSIGRCNRAPPAARPGRGLLLGGCRVYFYCGSVSETKYARIGENHSDRCRAAGGRSARSVQLPARADRRTFAAGALAGTAVGVSAVRPGQPGSGGHDAAAGGTLPLSPVRSGSSPACCPWVGCTFDAFDLVPWSGAGCASSPVASASPERDLRRGGAPRVLGRSRLRDPHSSGAPAALIFPRRRTAAWAAPSSASHVRAISAAADVRSSIPLLNLAQEVVR